VTSGGNNFNDFPENQLTKTTDKNEKKQFFGKKQTNKKHVILGHFGDVSLSQSLGLVWKKLNLIQQKHAFTNQKKCTTTQNI